MTRITVKVDGSSFTDEVEPRTLLVHYLREQLGKTGTVVGCDTGNCGACTVHLDGRSVKSCSLFAVQADGHEVTTIEGLATDGQLHPMQQAFHENHALAVRLLHTRHDHAVHRSAGRQSGSHRGRGPPRPRGQPLPLHRLPEHREGRPGRSRRGRWPMTTTEDRPATEIGNPRRRKEDARLITGRTRWTDNIVLPGMLHLAMVRSPFAHARITAIDTAAARAATGVIAVLTGADIADEQGALPNAWQVTPDQKAPVHPAMAVDHVAFAGEIVAMVVARNAAEANDAADLVDVDYEELPPVLDLRAAANGRGARPSGPRHECLRGLEVRLGRVRHRRRRRGGDRGRPRRRDRDREGDPPAAADPGVHGTTGDRRRPDP